MENNNSLHTSLYEIEALKQHFYPPIAELAEIIHNKFEVTKANTPLALSEEWKVQPYINDTYNEHIENILKDAIEMTPKEKKRKYNNNHESNSNSISESGLLNGAALNHRLSDVLFNTNSLGGSCFGK